MKHNTIIKITLLIGIIIGSNANICATSWGEYFSNLRQSASQWISSLSSGWSNLTAGQKAAIGATTAIICAGGLCLYKMNMNKKEEEKEKGKEEETLSEALNRYNKPVLILTNQSTSPWQPTIIFGTKEYQSPQMSKITIPEPLQQNEILVLFLDGHEIPDGILYQHKKFANIHILTTIIDEKPTQLSFLNEEQKQLTLRTFVVGSASMLDNSTIKITKQSNNTVRLGKRIFNIQEELNTLANQST